MKHFLIITIAILSVNYYKIDVIASNSVNYASESMNLIPLSKPLLTFMLKL